MQPLIAPDCVAEAVAAQVNTPKRRAVMDAAMTLFLAQGYGTTSIEQVARTANVSKATVYAYFASKDQLFATIVSERRPLFYDAAFETEVTDLRSALTTIGQTFLRFMLREQTLAIYRMAVAESARFPELGRAFFENGPQRGHTIFADWLERQQAAGLVSVPVPRIAAYQFMTLLRGCVFIRATLAVEPEPTDIEINETVAAAVDTWTAAFGRPRHAQPADTTVT